VRAPARARPADLPRAAYPGSHRVGATRAGRPRPTTRAAPVRNGAAPPARNRPTRAISWGRATRRSGWLAETSATTAARASGATPCHIIGVSVLPGRRQLTRIPAGPRSCARALVNPIRAAFEVL